MFERLMVLNQEAFDGTLYDVAYHALAAALHYARDQKDREALARVEVVATGQSEWIDRHAPDYAHSTANALGRGTSQSIFTLLAHQAAAHQKILALPPHTRVAPEATGAH